MNYRLKRKLGYISFGFLISIFFAWFFVNTEIDPILATFGIIILLLPFYSIIKSFLNARVKRRIQKKIQLERISKLIDSTVVTMDKLQEKLVIYCNLYLYLESKTNPYFRWSELLKSVDIPINNRVKMDERYLALIDQMRCSFDIGDASIGQVLYKLNLSEQIMKQDIKEMIEETLLAIGIYHQEHLNRIEKEIIDLIEN